MRNVLEPVIDKVNETLKTPAYLRKVQAEQQRAKDKEAEQQRILDLAKTMEDFIKSDIGEYFFNRLEEDRKQALAALVKQNPNQTDTVREIQNRVAVIDTVYKYYTEVLMSARQIQFNNR